MQQDLSGKPIDRKRLALKYMPGWPAALLAMLVASACSIYVHERGIDSAWTFLGLSVVVSLALWFITFMLDNWFHRPTHGTSGPIGMFYLWCFVRGIVAGAFIVFGLAGTWSYFASYLASIIVCGVIDTLFIITSL